MDTKLEQQHGWTHRAVMGVDEAGRGPWAGPVVAAAIILPADYGDYQGGVLAGLNDSKKLTPKKRELLFACLQNIPHGIGIVSVEEIDRINILQATFLAMRHAVDACPRAPDYILVDGTGLPKWQHAAQAVIRGDSLSVSIAAASVLAKVTRDRLMQKLDADYSGYGWARNKGYGTKAHRAGLDKYGVTKHHRQSYAPIRKLLEQADRNI